MVDMRYRIALIVASLSVLLIANVSNATYTVTNINTTVYLNTNTSGRVAEAVTVQISNASTAQYTIDRSGLNLTLSNWQSIIGPELVPHIINQKSGIYGFNLLPGAIIPNPITGTHATLYMSYYVENATFMNMTGPRSYIYRFNPRILNFGHGAGGVVLGPNTELNIVLPSQSTIFSVYPLPDVPGTVVTNSTNVTELSWTDAEPLYNFGLVFQLKSSLISEVIGFFGSIYHALGIFTFLIIAAVILLLILYTYLKARQ